MGTNIFHLFIDKHNKSANTNPVKGEEGFKKDGKEESMQWWTEKSSLLRTWKIPIGFGNWITG